MAKILITGGAGFIGSHLVRHFLQKKHHVVIVDNLSSSLKENIISGVKLYNIDVADKKLLTIFQKEKPDYVSHHAAQIKVVESIQNPTFDATSNILGTINVLKCARKTNVKKIIFSSTGGAIYGDTRHTPTSEKEIPMPQSPYAISKLSAEYYIKYFYEQYGLPYVIFRYANVYGPGQRSDNEGGVIAIFVKNIIKNKSCIIYGDGKQSRDFVYVADIVAANEKALLLPVTGIYNIGTESPTSVNSLASMIYRKFPKNKKKITYKQKREGEIMKSVLQITKAKKDLGWNPKVSISQGLDEMFTYYLKK